MNQGHQLHLHHRDLIIDCISYLDFFNFEQSHLKLLKMTARIGQVQSSLQAFCYSERMGASLFNLGQKVDRI